MDLHLDLGAETELRESGYFCVAGIDEAGCGAWAGPVFAGAVILKAGVSLPGVRDSKAMTLRQRLDAVSAIKDASVAWAIGVATPEEVDIMNVRKASGLAMKRAVERLSSCPDYLLVDAFAVPGTSIPQKGIVRGDSKILSIAAAAILAKTARDKHMSEMAVTFPGYGFERHVGYGTAEHSRAIMELGPSTIHRMSYAPVMAAATKKAA